MKSNSAFKKAALGLKALLKPKKAKIILIVSLVLAAAVGISAFAIPKIASGKTVDVTQVSMVSGSWWGEQQGCYGYIEEGGVYNVYLSNGLLPSETYVTVGQTVKAGDILFEYDMTALELAGESASISYKMAENDLKKAKELLEEYKGYTVYQPPKPKIIAGADKLQSPKDDSVSGSGTKEDPYVFTCDLETLVPPEFLELLTELTEQRPIIPDNSGSESDKPEGENTPAEGINVPGEEQPGNQESEQPPAVEGSEYETVVVRPASHAVLNVYHSVGSDYSSVLVDKITVNGAEDAEILKSVTENFALSDVVKVSTVGEVSLEEGSPIAELSHELALSAIPEPQPIPENQRETQDEIDELVSSQQKVVRDLELHVKQKKIDLDKAIAEIGGRAVVAEYGGTVQSVADVNNMSADSPYIVISSDTGYRVVGTVSETNLELVHVGDTLRVYSWMTGSEMSAVVTGIDSVPKQYGNSLAMENPNSSYYEFYATLDTEEQFERWSDVEIYFEAPVESGDSSVIYLPLIYVREAEDGSHYVLMLGENEKTVIQSVVTGKTIYGSMIEIKSGITMEDYIAFPYGKDAVEGASPNYDGEVYY